MVALRLTNQAILFMKTSDQLFVMFCNLCLLISLAPFVNPLNIMSCYVIFGCQIMYYCLLSLTFDKLLVMFCNCNLHQHYFISTFCKSIHYYVTLRLRNLPPFCTYIYDLVTDLALPSIVQCQPYSEEARRAQRLY